jgi:hypothetical protein
MMLLGRACRYVFCDTDPASVADLQAARERLGLRDEVKVIHGDGLAETTALLRARALDTASLVHIDPFDFDYRAASPGAVSAVELITCLAAVDIPAFAWYGLMVPSAAHELFHEVTTGAPTAQAWCAELHVSGRQADTVGIGPGCGVLFTAADLAPAGPMRWVADAFVRAFNEHSAAVDAGVHVTASFARPCPGPAEVAAPAWATLWSCAPCKPWVPCTYVVRQQVRRVTSCRYPASQSATRKYSLAVRLSASR